MSRWQSRVASSPAKMMASEISTFERRWTRLPGANHFFDGKLEPLMQSVTGYLDMRLANVR